LERAYRADEQAGGEGERDVDSEEHLGPDLVEVTEGEQGVEHDPNQPRYKEKRRA